MRAAFGRAFSIHRAFQVGVILKGVNGLLELIAGTLLLVGLSHNTALARHLPPHDERFAAIFLLSHGVIKGLLVYALLREKLWVFPWAISVFAGFGLYQIYRYVVEPSGWLIALTVLDVFVILLTWAEWLRIRGTAQRPSRPA